MNETNREFEELMKRNFVEKDPTPWRGEANEDGLGVLGGFDRADDAEPDFVPPPTTPLRWAWNLATVGALLCVGALVGGILVATNVLGSWWPTVLTMIAIAGLALVVTAALRRRPAPGEGDPKL